MSGRILNAVEAKPAFVREENRHNQTANNIKWRKGKQGQDIEVKGLRARFENQASNLGLDSGEYGPVVQDMFTVQEAVAGQTISEQIHHIHPLRNFDGLYANTTKQQAAQLKEILHSGDDIRNLMVMPKYAHQGIKGMTEAIHIRMKNAGVEHGGKQLHPVLNAIDGAHNADFKTKLKLAHEYNRQVRPKVEEILDDVILINEQMQDNVLADARKGTKATVNTMLDNQTYALMGKREKAAERARLFGKK